MCNAHLTALIFCTHVISTDQTDRAIQGHIYELLQANGILLCEFSVKHAKTQEITIGFIPLLHPALACQHLFVFRIFSIHNSETCFAHKAGQETVHFGCFQYFPIMLVSYNTQ